ncbi:hypothetical protein [Novilysobacter selenitireducens]|uniref:Uncharacterized protein n=1 Tax=Novilysobacter selenitireducens TaxID=2872639 RepID=A0ABS7T8Z5_9GAMM|nr:hypothetical protein [Lysobacter selenitireducens]MBZ4040363.1 hypothetical protein [Lysobacter selenitireducens]
MVGTFAGIAVGWLVIMLSQLLSAALYPPPPGTDLTDPAVLADFINAAPVAAMACVIAGYALAALLGGWLAARLARPRLRTAATVVGGMVLLGVVLNYTMIPHPTWMLASGVLLPLPMAWLGARLAGRRARAPNT